MALFWRLQCDSDNCDFSATIGWTHELPAGIRLAFCSRCFAEVHVEEVCDPEASDYLPDVRLMRVLIAEPNPRCQIPGKNPRERRRLRRSLDMPASGKIPLGVPRLLFRHNGSYLYYEHGNGPIEGVEQATCPYCGQADCIVIGFSNDNPKCPKCKKGTIVCVASSGW
ncbi:MAG: hypothetical protein JNM43_06570 [Planctomycetaceae bacterium]|nr:hypothetical protein [Planctomycetaceae bacterium]